MFSSPRVVKLNIPLLTKVLLDWTRVEMWLFGVTRWFVILRSSFPRSQKQSWQFETDPTMKSLPVLKDAIFNTWEFRFAGYRWEWRERTKEGKVERKERSEKVQGMFWMQVDTHCSDGDNSPPEFVILLRDMVALWPFAALSTWRFSSSHLSESRLTGYFLAFSRVFPVIIIFVQHQTYSIISLALW